MLALPQARLLLLPIGLGRPRLQLSGARGFRAGGGWWRGRVCRAAAPSQRGRARPQAHDPPIDRLAHALALLAQQVQDLSQAAKRIASSPIEPTEPQPPELLLTWAHKGMAPAKENVRDTFKQLSVQKAAEEKQRALREDIAAAQAAEAKAAKKSKLTLGKSKTSAAMVPKGAHLEQSRSVPALLH